MKHPPPSLLKACANIHPHKPLSVVKNAYDQAFFNFIQLTASLMAEMSESHSGANATATVVKLLKVKQILRYHHMMCIWSRTIILESFGEYQGALNAKAFEASLAKHVHSFIPSTVEESDAIMQQIVPPNCWEYLKALHPYTIIYALAVAENANAYLEAITNIIYHQLSSTIEDVEWRVTLWLEPFAVGTLLGVFDAQTIKRFETALGCMKEHFQYIEDYRQLEQLVPLVSDKRAAQAALLRGKLTMIKVCSV